MSHGLNIRADAELDFLSLGALVHRLDTGIIPFRKATECKIHVSGGEFNVAANLADCFGLKTAVASAMSDYPIGDLIAERVRAMGVKTSAMIFGSISGCGWSVESTLSSSGFDMKGSTSPAKRLMTINTNPAASSPLRGTIRARI